jgi:AcrR family transcriptional regulator
VAQQHDRAKLIAVALDLCTRQGYDATTLDQIAAAAGVVPQELARHFATKEAVILSFVDDIVHAHGAALARVAPNADPLEALLIAYTETFAAIVNDVGVTTRERLLALAHILTAQPHLRQQVTDLRRRVLAVPLAAHMGVAADDRRVRHALTLWAAIMTGSYNFPGSAGVHPRDDGRVPELMVQRLHETFVQVTGLEPPEQASHWTSAPRATYT